MNPTDPPPEPPDPASDPPPEPADQAAIREREQAESVERIAAGGIPVSAERRLNVLATGKTAFTSSLTVAGFAMLDRLGPRPLAQVLGASVHQVGWQFLPPAT